jgi:hypothetical protein
LDWSFLILSWSTSNLAFILAWAAEEAAGLAVATGLALIFSIR